MKGNEVVMGIGAALGLGLLAFYLYMNKTPVVENARNTRGLPEHLMPSGGIPEKNLESTGDASPPGGTGAKTSGRPAQNMGAAGEGGSTQ